MCQLVNDNDTTNMQHRIDSVPLVHIATGKEVEPQHASYLRRTVHPEDIYGADRVAFHFFGNHELTQKGVPDARKRGQWVGVQRDVDGDYRGYYGILNSVREQRAYAIRQNIDVLERKLRNAKNELLALYEGDINDLNERGAKQLERERHPVGSPENPIRPEGIMHRFG